MIAVVYTIVKEQQKINDKIKSGREQAQNECERLAKEVSHLEEEAEKAIKYYYEHVR